MHSYLSRLNAVFFFGLMCLGTCGVIAALSSFIPFVNPPDSAKNLIARVTGINLDKFITGSAVLRPRVRRSRYEVANIDLNGNIDLTDEWHWNTKQIFIWLSANYKTNKKSSEISLWDRLIESKEESIFNLYNAKTEYDLIDMDLSLKGNNISYILRWDIHPWIGFISRKVASNDQIYSMIMPDKPEKKSNIKSRDKPIKKEKPKKKKKRNNSM
mmetsp:Transcript_73113/g.89706  ORF Transcript_73113/g.89706 Transcript_73113/m.89706 type:complete len:214 (-) Transcript_73113:87-728(-)